MSNKKQTWANAHSQLWTSSVARSAGSRTQSEVSSIASTNRDRSLLDDADGYHQPPSHVCPQELRHQAYQPNDKTLAQVSDILESYGAIACDADIPAVLLEVVKELERTKRDNNFKDLLLREYSDTVQRRFGLYGEESPPSIAEVSARLRDGAPARPVAAPNPAWLEQPLNELWRTVCDGMQACFEKNADLSAPVLLPEARRTKANVSQLLHTSCDVLSQLAKEYTTAKAAVMKKMERTVAASQSFRQLTLSTALSELEAQQELKGSAAEDGGASAMDGSHTVGSALQSLIDVIPASLQIHFGLQVPEAPVLTRCNSLTELIRFLLSEYLSMERYMEMVEAERQRLAEVFYLPPSKADANGDLQLDEALSRSLRSLQETVTSVVAFPHHISEEEMVLRHSSAQAVEELAQLLVDARRGGSVSGSCAPHSVAAVRVEPPTRNLLEMVELVKSRFATVMAQQQRKELAGAQGRVGLAHMEESMTRHGKQVVQLLRDLCVAQEDAAADSEVSEQLLVEVMGNVDLERNLTPAKLDHFLSDVVERLRMVKTKYQRALNAAAAGKARAEAASQKSTGLQKRLQKVAAAVERIGRDGLGLTFPSTPAASGIGSAGEADDAGKGRDDAEGGRRGNGVSALRRLNLRPALEPATATKASSLTTTKDGTANETDTPGAAVTEHNVLEALQLVASRIGTSGEVRDWAVVQEELAQLRAGKARWKADTSAFHEAMAMLMQRLAKNGQMVKQTLFLMGTDESANDELVEEVLQRDSEEEVDRLSAEAMEYVERSLAELLQKYNRWAQRLLQTTEDHLDTQRKIVKYFAAVCRFFSPKSRAAAAPAEDIPEDNLYDIDSCLMRAADIILPSLDAAIQAAAQEQCPASATATPDAPATLPPLAPSSGDTATSGATPRQETLVQLARDSTAAATGGVLPYDHRIARLYETVARLYTVVTSLLQVHYLCIPSASRRRSSGETELLFDGDANDDGFVDIDLDRLIRVSQQQSAAASAPPAAARGDGVEQERFSKEGHGGDSAGKTPTPSPPSTIAANNDLILRVTYQNMEVLQDTLKRFSANHKMAAIVLQKDVDTMQQLLAGMLEKYSEVDMEGAFGQSRETLHELYVTLRDRGQRQKGCYFFNRVGGEGSCTWVTALEHLADGFRGVVDRLVQRTTLAAEYRRLVDEVVDVCAMYMNWAERRTLPASHALPPELLALCVRDSSEVTAKPTVTTMVEGGQSSCPGGDVEASTKPASGGTATINATTATVAASAAQRPPKPSRMPPLTPRASNKEQQERQQQHQAGQERGVVVPTAASAAETKISYFTNDGAVLKVMTHMFQLAQLNVESPPATGNKTGDAAAFDADAKVQQLTEEMQLLREAVAIAEHHVDELTDAKHVVELQRDQAQSEAAVARAELRRWKRQKRQQHEQQQSGRTPAVADGAQVHSPPRSPREAASTHQPDKTADGVDAVLDEATVKEVMEYMRVLSEELQTAKRRVSGSSARARKLVRSPCQAASSLRASGAVPKDYADVVRKDDGEEGNAADGDEDAPYGAPHSHRNRRSYTELAEQLRHQYGSTAIAPMVIIDPKTHSYSNSQRRRSGHARDGSSEASHVQNRYSPVKYRGPEYDACDRYYARELAQVLIEEGEHAAHPRRYRSIDARHPATTKPAFSGSASAPASQRHLSGESSRGAAAPSARDVGVCHLGGGGNSAAAAPRRRYPPRSLSRDEPLLSPGAAAASASLASPRACHAPQRATSVAAAAAPSYRLFPKPATPGACRHSSGNALFSTPMEACAHHHRSHYDRGDNRPRCADTDEGEEVFYDAGTPRAQTGWRWSTPSWAAPQPRRRPSAARERLCSPHEQSTKASILSQQRCPKVHDGRCEPTEDVGESLAAAVRQIDAVTQRSTATPTRRGSQAGSRQDTLHGSPVSVPPASTPATPASEQQMSRNANLRAAALRRLAEVVSKTAVPSTRRAQF